MPTRPVLVVLLDGAPLDDADARDVWSRFSRHMDENPGDLAGFAKDEGLFAVRPEHQRGQAVLLAFTTEEAERAAPRTPKIPAPAPTPKPNGAARGGKPAPVPVKGRRP